MEERELRLPPAEPVEKPMVSTPDGIWCQVHGEMDCAEPFCWRCGNHLMDDFGRCADPRCRATNTPAARAVIEGVKARWKDRPAPLEAIDYALGRFFLGDGGQSFAGSGAEASGEHAPDLLPS